MTKEKATDSIKKPVIDLSTLDTGKASDEGARVEINHPTTNVGIGLFITVLGKHSQIFRELVRERVNKRVRAEALATRRGKPLEPETAENMEQGAVELLAACTLAWDSGEDDPTLTIGGEKLPFNTANALRVYSEMLWLREQVDEAIGDLENFIKA